MWQDIPGNPLWEYSDSPNTDKKAIDSYDYDAFANHVSGIRNLSVGCILVLARQKDVLHPGYGEIYSYDEIDPSPPVGVVTFGGEDVTFNGDSPVTFDMGPESSFTEDGTPWLTEDGTPVTQEDGTP